METKLSIVTWMKEKVTKSKIFYGWWMIVAAAPLNLIAGGTIFYGFTVFFNPIRQTFGWGAAVTSIVFSIRGVETGIFDPFIGWLIDKLGPRRVMLAGWIINGIGFLLMSRINSLWQFYGSFAVVTVGMAMGAGMSIYTAIANWFTKKRSRAMALLQAGWGSSGLLAMLLALLISQYGWRTTLVIVAVASWVIGIPLSLLMRHKPSQYGYLPDGETITATEKQANLPNHSSSEIKNQPSVSLGRDFTVRRTLRTPAFWLLCSALFFQNIGSSPVLLHIVPYLESVKISTAIALTAVGANTFVSLLGRLVFGFLGDFRNKRYLIAIAFFFQAIGLFIFSLIDTSRVWLVIPFLLTFSPGFGGPIPLRIALQADYFGINNFATIFGLIALISTLGQLASPVVAGWIFDVTGSYRLAWQLFALTTLPAIPLILLAKAPKAK